MACGCGGNRNAAKAKAMAKKAAQEDRAMTLLRQQQWLKKRKIKLL
jgi:hypothetical protein